MFHKLVVRRSIAKLSIFAMLIALGITATPFGLRTLAQRRMAGDRRVVSNAPESILADGGLDTGSFNTAGTPGYLRTTFATPGFDNDQAARVGVQSTGKIIVAGDTSVGGPNHMAFERVNSDGTLDTSVQIAASSFGAATAVATTDMVIASDKIYLLGRSSGNPSCSGNVAIAVFKADTTPDTSFGTGGFKSFNAFSGSNCNESPQALAVQPDGKIVVAGFATDNNTTFFTYLARFNADGTTDTGFGGTAPLGGVQGQARFPPGLAAINDLVIQPDTVVANPPKIVAGGGSSGTGNFTLYRFTSTGALDTTFNGTGTVVTTFTTGSQINSLALYSDGRILAGGEWGGSGSGPEFALARYSRDGALDSAAGSFGTAGIVKTDMSNGADSAKFVGISSTGKIIATGIGNGSPVPSIAIARYLPNGTLDTATFGASGKVLDHLGTVAANNNVPTAPGGALQSDGKILVAGQLRTENVSNSEDFYVARFRNATQTAANVSVSGRVMASGGRGLTNAVVTLTGPDGSSQSMVTGRGGVFNFDNVETGKTYIISVGSQRFVYQAQVVTVNDGVSGLAFAPQ